MFFLSTGPEATLKLKAESIARWQCWPALKFVKMGTGYEKFDCFVFYPSSSHSINP